MEQGKFWELHDRLVAHVPDNQSELDDLIENLGIDRDRLNGAVREHTYREKIDAGKLEAGENGITDVGLFINGKEYQKYPGTFEDLCQAIDDKLERLEAEND